jgi:Flp pilus assembly protein protease CpaA
LAGRSPVLKGIAQLITVVLPYLASFDLREATVTGKIAIPGTGFANFPQAISLSALFGQMSMAGIYALCYVTLALALGMFLFHNRELGGAES